MCVAVNERQDHVADANKMVKVQKVPECQSKNKIKREDMEKIAFENYRCIKNSGPIAIKPITILLGANSSGKSSVLKFFPLLKQSSEKKTRGTFLWYGPFVDFQDFSNVVMEGENSMTISFDIEKATSNFITVIFHHTKRTTFKDLHVELRIEKKSKGATEYLSEVRISFAKCDITIKYKDAEKIESISVNSTTLAKDNLRCINRGDVIPLCIEQYTPDGPIRMENIGSQALPHTLFKAIQNLGTNDFQKKHSEIDEKVREHLASYNALCKAMSACLDSTDHIEEICNAYILENINIYISTINQYLEALAQRIHYVQPLRATSQRYYRFSNVDVDEIDSDGKNIPMFYASLEKSDREKFNKWLSQILPGTQLEIQTKSGFVELLLKEKGKSAHNMVDVGFGYTQILPILILIWKVAYLPKQRSLPVLEMNTETIIAIEQPELHLHPRMQGLFADMLSTVIKKCHEDKIDIRFIIETHSENIVSRLGENIELNNLDANNVNVVLFDALKEGFSTEIHPTEFDNRGILKDWPYNFFTHNVY